MDARQPEADRVRQACRDDLRVTRVGAFIRRTTLLRTTRAFTGKYAY